MSAQPRQGPPPPPPLLLPTFPGATLLLSSPESPGGKLILKLTPEGAQEPGRTQAIVLAGAPAGWAAPRRDGPPLRLQLAAGIRTILLSKAGEPPGPREAPTPAPPARTAPPSDPAASCTSKGVYENYRRWQRYKALARRHFPSTPDAEALACFFIPVLRSLSRLRPALALEEGVPRAVQEWERSSNFERMIFYEMAEKFMEFEVEEELQIQKMKLLSSSQFQSLPAEPPKFPGPPAPDAGQHQVYIPKKAASKGRQPRRRQRRPPGLPAPGESREIPPEAVRQYTEIMEGLRPGWEEEAGEDGGRGEPQSQLQGVLPDPGLLRYLERLCEDESFVCKVEAVIHPQFLAQLLSPEKRRDLLDLSEELEGELSLSPSQLVEKRLLALSEEELSPMACPAPQSDSTPSQSDEEDEGGGPKGLAGGHQAICGSSPSRGGGAKGRVLEAEPLEGSSPVPGRLSLSCQQQLVAMASEDAVAPRGPSPHQRDGQGRPVASLRSRVVRVSQKPQGQGQDGGQREESGVTPGPVQPGNRAWGLRSQGDNLVGPANLESPPSGYRIQDGGQERKVKGWCDASAGGEGLGDASIGTECNCQGDKPVKPRSLESTLNGQGNQDGCQGEMVKGQPQAGWEVLGDVPRAPGQAKIVRSPRDNLVEQRALESPFNGHGKQDGCQGETVRGQNQEEADLKEAALRERDLQPGRMKLRGNNLKGEGSPAASPTGLGEQDGSRVGQPTKLESRAGTTHPPVSLLGRASERPFDLSTHPLGVDGRGEGEWPPGSNLHSPCPDPKGPTEAQAASKAKSSHRAEPEGRWVMANGSPRPCLQDGGIHEGNSIGSPARPGDPGQQEAGATGGWGNLTRSWDDGNKAREASPAMGDGPSKMATVTHVPRDVEDAGKRGDDEDLSIFSSLLASKLRLSSPEGPTGAVPIPWDQEVPHGRAPSPTWGPTRWDAMRRRSTHPDPGEGLDGSHPMDPGIRHSHKRRSDKTATRRSKRLRSQ